MKKPLTLQHTNQNNHIMKKRTILLLCMTMLMSLGVANNAFAQNMTDDAYYEKGCMQIQLNVQACLHAQHFDSFEPHNQDLGNKPSRAPIKAPTIGFDGQCLYLYCQFGELTLELLDNGATVYSTAVQANVDEVALPCMPGTYELRLCDGRYVYSCELDIQ